MPEFFDRLLGVTEVRQVTDLITTIGTQYRLAWVPVGDNDNNLANRDNGRLASGIPV